MKPRKLCWGCLHRRQCLVPTPRGWVLFTLLSIALVVTGVLRVHPFLAVTESVPGGVLVVEGWVPDYALEEAQTEFKRNRYHKLYVTGGPLGRGEYLSEYKTYAELGAATLVRMGMSTDTVEAVPAPWVQQDRTHASAMTLRGLLQQRAAGEVTINVVSLGVHARRSRLLFQRVFGGGTQVGVIAIEDRGYDPRRWWKFSQGVRTVIDEFVAYIYARIIFPFV